MKVTLYIAQSIDGYIADSNGSVDWLEQFNDTGEDYGYTDFLQTVDHIVMGGNTYRQVLDFGEWPYSDTPTTVFTSQELGETKGAPITIYTSGSVSSFIEQCEAQNDVHLWLVGGAELIQSFLKEQCINEMRIFTMPVLLGKGIPLFLERDSVIDRIHETAIISYDSGVIEARYTIHTDNE